jgi:hypothetical protein
VPLDEEGYTYARTSSQDASGAIYNDASFPDRDFAFVTLQLYMRKVPIHRRKNDIHAGYFDPRDCSSRGHRQARIASDFIVLTNHL